MWASVASAQDDVSVELVDHLLDVSLSGWGERQTAALTELSTRVAATDPVGPQVWYWLGRAQAEQDHVDDARQTLLEGIRSGGCPRCRELFQVLEVERIAATRGTTWTFDDPHHGVFLAAAGTLRLQEVDGRRVLEWVPDPGGEPQDRLVFGVRDGVAELGIVVAAVGAGALLHVKVEDVAGHQFLTPTPFPIPTDRWAELQVDLRDLAPVIPGPPPRPADIRRVELIDSAATSGRLPPLWLDTLSVR